jgi:hypothetical protein
VVNFSDYRKLSQVKEAIVSAIRGKESYQNFCKNATFPGPSKKEFELPGFTLYKPENGDKYFISLDLIKANFNSLRYVDPDMVLGCHTWEDLVSQFSSLEYLKQSKYYRQMIFGNLNGKKTLAVSSHIIKEVYSLLLENKPKDFILHTRSLTQDEIIIECPDNKSVYNDAKLVHQLVQTCLPPNLRSILRFELFQLKMIDGKNIFVKESFPAWESNDFSTVKPSFKCVPPSFFAQCYKKYFGLPITEWDRKVVVEGMVATFDAPYFQNK